METLWYPHNRFEYFLLRCWYRKERFPHEKNAETHKVWAREEKQYRSGLHWRHTTRRALKHLHLNMHHSASYLLLKCVLKDLLARYYEHDNVPVKIGNFFLWFCSKSNHQSNTLTLSDLPVKGRSCCVTFCCYCVCVCVSVYVCTPNHTFELFVVDAEVQRNLPIGYDHIWSIRPTDCSTLKDPAIKYNPSSC